MAIDQALAPDDLSAMQIRTVPDLWPPIDHPSTAGLGCQQADGFADPGADGRPGQAAGGGPAWPRQFAVLLAEALTGDRPIRQVRPWLSQRGSVHLHRLLPLFSGSRGARVQRVMTTQPSPDVIEMTLIVAVGPRVRALAVRLTLVAPDRRPGGREKQPVRAAEPRAVTSARWLCTDIEAA